MPRKSSFKSGHQHCRRRRPLRAASSIGRRNTLAKSLCWRLDVQRFPRPLMRGCPKRLCLAQPATNRNASAALAGSCKLRPQSEDLQTRSLFSDLATAGPRARMWPFAILAEVGGSSTGPTHASPPKNAAVRDQPNRRLSTNKPRRSGAAGNTRGNQHRHHGLLRLTNRKVSGVREHQPYFVFRCISFD